MTTIPPELIEKAKTAKTAEELLEIAKANGVEMTADEASAYFAQLNPTSGEIDDDDLDSVAGGACGSSVRAGDNVRVTSGETCQICGGNTGTVKSVGAFGTGAVVCENCPDSIIAYVGSAKLEKI